MLATKAYAAQSAGSPLTPHAIERRDPGRHDVVIDISYCGICHTDIHFVNNDFGLSQYPLVPGHEIVGRVTAVGDDVTKFRPGDAVGVGCLVDSCRECEWCRNGLEQHCEKGWILTYSCYERDGETVTQGGYSTTIVVDERFVLRFPDLPPEQAAPLLCAGITTYSPLRRWNIGEGHKVAVVGLGGLGHMAVKLAASMGAEVTVLSTSPEKESDSRRLGAHDFVVTTDDAQLGAVANRFDFILDTLAAAHDYSTYVQSLRTGGTVVCVGVPPEPIQVHSMNIIFTRKCIAGSVIGGLPETQEMLDYCADHNITADVEVIPMQQVNTAYERMLKNDVKYRFVIDMASLK